MQRSKIEWLKQPDGKYGYTWNPIKMRCTPVSAGCQNCWHIKFARRHASNPTFPQDARSAYLGGSPFMDQKELLAPMRVKEASFIAVQLMGDLFHESVLDTYIDDIFAVMAMAGSERQCCRIPNCDHEDCPTFLGDGTPEPIQTFVVLTKRPKLMAQWFVRENIGCYIEEASRRVGWAEDPEEMVSDAGWPLKNVWVGVSVEDQATADERIPLLLQTPAAHRWISVEPMLSEINIRSWLRRYDDGGIDQIVCGAETGPGKRPCRPEWIDNMREQCKAAGVPFFGKVDQSGKPMAPREWPRS